MDRSHYDNAIGSIADAHVKHDKFAGRFERIVSDIISALNYAGADYDAIRLVDLGENQSGPTVTYDEAKHCHVDPNGEVHCQIDVKLGPSVEHLKWYRVPFVVRTGVDGGPREVKVGKGAYLPIAEQGDAIAKAILDSAVAIACGKLAGK